MIKSFARKETKNLFEKGKSKRFKNIERIAIRKLQLLDSIDSVQDLKSPPSNHFEKLTGDRNNQYSIRINNQFRICFTIEDNNKINEVEIVDYH